MTKETIAAIIGAVAVVLKAPAEKLIAKVAAWIGDKMPWKNKKKKRDAQVIRLLQGLGGKYKFNRITISSYDGFKEIPVSLEDFRDIKLTITHEWKDAATSSVINDFKDASCEMFAPDLLALNESKTGWIRINAQSAIQNLWMVVESYRFRMGAFTTDGSMALSFMNHDNIREFTDEELLHMKVVALQIHMILYGN